MPNNVMVHKHKNKYIQMEIKCMISIVMMLKLKPEKSFTMYSYEEFLAQLDIMWWLMTEN